METGNRMILIGEGAWMNPPRFARLFGGAYLNHFNHSAGSYVNPCLLPKDRADHDARTEKAPSPGPIRATEIICNLAVQRMAETSDLDIGAGAYGPSTEIRTRIDMPP